MKNFFIFFFGVLLILSVVVCIVGLLTAAIFPWFGGMRADHIGEIGMGLAAAGECAAWCLGPLFMHILDKPDKRKNQLGLSGGKKYGNKKPVA